MSMIVCKYGCLSDTDEEPDFGFEEIKCSDGTIIHEYTCESHLESFKNLMEPEDDTY